MALLRAPLALRPGTLMPSIKSGIQRTAAAASTSIRTAPFSSSSHRPAGQGFVMPDDYLDRAEADNVSVGQLRRTLVSEKDVLITGLPTTATPLDIRALARETKTFNDVGRIEFMYTRSFQPTGKALVSFSATMRARMFEEDAHGRIVGGKMIKANLRSVKQRKDFLLKAYGNWPADYQIPFDLIEYDTGKLVLLRGIPQDTFEARLEERLAPRYDLKPQDRWRAKRISYAGYLHDSKGYGGSHDAVLGGVLKLPKSHPDATTANFIVRCETQSEAMRLVRRWHNTYFAPRTFDIQDTGGRYRVAASVLY
ncbi:Nucleotide-binding, alpha-beta plait [Kalmanozyma brasiliensis GHG001]|uniref:RRM domain-containing protein n=1 Tax=Kalmanozyma brasiliensis (strain GHG001) TaxID=1365824 RepID=V5EZA4_KALBG|nr:Nucleotide-binding, alpha-beta plait [Kalmanozyma brasiliensis GHG001]EST09218.1 Nucleotide-binding, alpha-beta plait [Kalmanozyma brasiliensis GHG001]